MFTFADAVREWSIKTPIAPAWWIDVDGELKSFSWAQVEQALLHVACSLSEHGLVAGDRLVSYLPNSLGWALIDLACALRGILHVPVDYRLPAVALERVVNQTQGFLVRSVADVFWIHDGFKQGTEGTQRTESTRPYHRSRPLELTNRTTAPPAFITSLPSFVPHQLDDLAIYRWSRSDFAPISFEELRTPVRPEDPANILFTSGTTSAPLGVTLSHVNLVLNARAKLDAIPQFAHDRRLNILPFAHAYARTCELSTWALSGGSMMSVQDYDQLLLYGSRFEPSLINAVPYVFQKLQRVCEEVESIELRQQALTTLLGSKLRCLASGGAGLPIEVYRFFKQLGLPIIQGYGLTEASPVVCSNRSDNPKEDCVGTPIQNTEIRIDKDQRLYVKGPGVMLGYWGHPVETSHRIQDGWLDTGDRAEQSPDGTLRILGRVDDRISLSTGYKVDPASIEHRLIGKSGIRNCMLIGNGQRFLIAIVVVDSDQEAILLQTIQDALVDYPDYCIPKRLIVEKNFWTESSGMVNRKGSLRRIAIAEHYRHEIAAIYCSTVGRKQVALNPSDRAEQNGDRTEQGHEVQQ